MQNNTFETCITYLCMHFTPKQQSVIPYSCLFIINNIYSLVCRKKLLLHETHFWYSNEHEDMMNKQISLKCQLVIFSACLKDLKVNLFPVVTNTIMWKIMLNNLLPQNVLQKCPAQDVCMHMDWSFVSNDFNTSLISL